MSLEDGRLLTYGDDIFPATTQDLPPAPRGVLPQPPSILIPRDSPFPAAYLPASTPRSPRTPRQAHDPRCAGELMQRELTRTTALTPRSGLGVRRAASLRTLSAATTTTAKAPTGETPTTTSTMTTAVSGLLGGARESRSRAALHQPAPRSQSLQAARLGDGVSSSLSNGSSGDRRTSPELTTQTRPSLPTIPSFQSFFAVGNDRYVDTSRATFASSTAGTVSPSLQQRRRSTLTGSKPEAEGPVARVVPLPAHLEAVALAAGGAVSGVLCVASPEPWES